ncbi:MAG: glycerol-3-phosphate 1-O-acyltransferase PlsY [Candidatus Omnitrophica bacterium]|nr:glycerol-3-phosphate 1-O-acyltransferase PlsY [Candidatus Omnitrophota bacterium]
MPLKSLLIFSSLAYLIGSIPFGLLIGKCVKGIDIRESGSRNIGATNVFRVVGKKWGILVFILDAVKGYLGPTLLMLTGHSTSMTASLILGIATILGHTFPVWLKFKGGKGVATSLGVFLAIAWKPTAITFGIWVLIFAITHIISISSLAAAVCFPVAIYFTSRDLEGARWLLITSLILAVFIFYTHRHNIARLRKGEEKRLF